MFFMLTLFDICYYRHSFPKVGTCEQIFTFMDSHSVSASHWIQSANIHMFDQLKNTRPRIVKYNSWNRPTDERFHFAKQVATQSRLHNKQPCQERHLRWRKTCLLDMSVFHNHTRCIANANYQSRHCCLE